jgi:hypothetical protein
MPLTGQDSPPSSAEPASSQMADIARLVRAVRRLMIAVWCLAGLLVAVYVLPWASFYWQTRNFNRPSAGTAPEPASESAVPSFIRDYDNQFHSRSPEEKVKRATVIFLAQTLEVEGKHKAVITEIVKRAPGVSFYYAVGDEYPTLSHVPSGDCEGCEGDGSIVFLIGDPAMMTSAYSYRNGRIDSMGGLSLDQLREMARSAVR